MSFSNQRCWVTFMRFLSRVDGTVANTLEGNILGSREAAMANNEGPNQPVPYIEFMQAREFWEVANLAAEFPNATAADRAKAEERLREYVRVYDLLHPHARHHWSREDRRRLED